MERWIGNLIYHIKVKKYNSTLALLINHLPFYGVSILRLQQYQRSYHREIYRSNFHRYQKCFHPLEITLYK